MSRTAACGECTTPGGISVTKRGVLYSHDRIERCPGSGQPPTEAGACGECGHPHTPVTGQGVLQDHGRGVKCPGSCREPAEGATPRPTARDSIENLWDRATPVRPLLDAYRDEVALDLGRDLLRDGLDAFLRRLVGLDNANALLSTYRAEVRREDAAIVRTWKIPHPNGDVDDHVNDVLERLAADIERGPL